MRSTEPDPRGERNGPWANWAGALVRQVAAPLLQSKSETFLPFGTECHYVPPYGIRKPSTTERDDVMSDIDQTSTEAAVPDQEASLVEEELLVEEISIDGMCGVY